MLALIFTRKLRPMIIGSSSGWLMLAGMMARPRATSLRTNSASSPSRSAMNSISGVIDALARVVQLRRPRGRSARAQRRRASGRRSRAASRAPMRVCTSRRGPSSTSPRPTIQSRRASGRPSRTSTPAGRWCRRRAAAARRRESAISRIGTRSGVSPARAVDVDLAGIGKGVRITRD